MKKTFLAYVATPMLLAYLASAGLGCKKEEELAPPPPPVTPAPAPEPIVIAPEIEEEDAGEDVVEEAAVKKAAKPADVGGLRACCNALQQNAASMPPPNNAWALQAAAVCQGMVQQMAAGSKSKGDALAMIGGALKGAALPAACK